MSELSAVSGRVGRTGGASDPGLPPEVLSAFRAARFPAGFDDPATLLRTTQLTDATPTVSHVLQSAGIPPFRALGTAITQALVALNEKTTAGFRLSAIEDTFVGLDFAAIAQAEPATRAQVIAALDRFSAALGHRETRFAQPGADVVTRGSGRERERIAPQVPRSSLPAPSAAPGSRLGIIRSAPEESVAPAQPRTPQPGTAQRGGVLVVGDSHAEALGPAIGALPHGGGRVRTIYSRGAQLGRFVSGTRRGNELDAALANRPDVVVISLGTNDGRSNIPAAQVRARALEIVGRARAAGAHVIFALPLKTTDLTAGVDAARTALANTLRGQPGVTVVDVSSQRIPLRDGTHATLGPGYRQWARFILSSADAPAVAALERAGNRVRR